MIQTKNKFRTSDADQGTKKICCQRQEIFFSRNDTSLPYTADGKKKMGCRAVVKKRCVI